MKNVAIRIVKRYGLDKKFKVAKDRKFTFTEHQFYYKCLFNRNIYKPNEYYKIYIPEHPFASFNGYVMLHRLLLELKLERYLEKDEVSHHIDEDKSHNDPSNLGVMTFSEHTRHHRENEKHQVGKFKCPICGKKFKRDMQRARSHWREGRNGPFCSLSCSTTNRWTKEFVRKNKPYKIIMLKKRCGT